MDATPDVIDAVPLQSTPDIPRNFFVTGYSLDPVGMEQSLSPPNTSNLSRASMFSQNPGTFHNSMPAVRNVGPPEPPRLERIVRKVSGKNSQSKMHESSHRPKMILDIGAFNLPSYMNFEEPDDSEVKMPTANATASAHQPRVIPGIGAVPPPSYVKREDPDVSELRMPPRQPLHAQQLASNGLPPRAPPKTSKQQSEPKSSSNKNLKRDPLLHKALATPPCPIHHCEYKTPDKDRRYTHRPDLPEYLIPRVGMVFKNFYAARDFYNRYARHVGFGTKIGQTSCYTKYLICTCEGKYTSAVHEAERQRDKTTRRCNCEARLRIKTNKYDQTVVIVDLNFEHNHKLITL